jgi:hypothetical protein
VDIKHFFEGVGGVGMEVGLEGANGILVKVVVLLDEGLVLLLDLDHLVIAELIVVELDF